MASWDPAPPQGQGILGQSAWLAGGKVVAVAASLVVNALLARLLAPSSLGAYFLSSSIISVAAVFALFGVNQAAVRLIAESLAQDEPGRGRSAVKQALVFALSGSVVVGLAFYFGGWRFVAIHVFHSAEMAGITTLAVAWLWTLVALNLVVAYLKGFRLMRLVALFEGLLSSVLLGAFLLTTWVARGAVGLSSVVSLAVVALAASAITATVPAWPRARAMTGTGRVTASEMTRIAWPMLVIGLLGAALGSVSDLWILGGFTSPSEVARYASSLRLATVVSFPFLAFAGALAPMIAELNAIGRRDELERMIRAGTALAGILAVACLAVFVFFGDTLLTLIYGSYYARGSSILIVLAIAQTIFVLTGPCGLVLVMTGHQVAGMVQTLLAAVLSVAADLWAAPRFGAIGVAVATGSSLAIADILGVVMARRLTGMWTFARFSKTDIRTLLRTFPSGSA